MEELYRKSGRVRKTPRSIQFTSLHHPIVGLTWLEQVSDRYTKLKA
jgi:hypothetical protein